jgi:hypothetical protein
MSVFGDTEAAVVTASVGKVLAERRRRGAARGLFTGDAPSRATKRAEQR